MTWVKGKSGNPNGRPPVKRSFSDAVKQLLDAKSMTITWEVNGQKKKLNVKSNKNMAHGLAAALITEGIKGNVNATRELVDRAEGKPQQAIDFTGSVSGIDFSKMSEDEIREFIKQYGPKE